MSCVFDMMFTVQATFFSLANMPLKAIVLGKKNSLRCWLQMHDRSNSDHLHLVAKDSLGGTLLHYAAWFNAPEMAQLLITYGAGISVWLSSIPLPHCFPPSFHLSLPPFLAAFIFPYLSSFPLFHLSLFLSLHAPPPPIPPLSFLLSFSLSSPYS